MYVAENGRQRISKIDTSGNVTHVSGVVIGEMELEIKTTQFRNIQQMAFDSNGNLFVVESGNHKIKKLVLILQLALQLHQILQVQVPMEKPMEMEQMLNLDILMEL
jgi:hypothetical protein